MLGTRPNDTLRPLELLKPHRQYPLPNLSRDDFDEILQNRHVSLERNLVDRFYETLEKNALYLDLVAKELAARRQITHEEVEEIVRQISEDPENLFSLSIERLSWQRDLWREVIKPVLGLLLATSEPLSRLSLKHLLNLAATTQIDGEQLDRGLASLGGLVVVDDRQRYSLFHLKFRDYLRQDTQRPQKRYLFDLEDEQAWHRRFAAWCEQGGLARIWEESVDAIEQGRRRYARQHYLTHLYQAGDWSKLFRVLDEGAYGRAKIADDPSMRAYALDLDLGRKAAASPDWSLPEAIAHLPHLWRYTLLRCGLASRADNYPQEAFELMVLLGDETKALGLADLLTDPARKAAIFTLIAGHLAEQPGREREAQQLFVRAERVIGLIRDEWHQAEALVQLATALAQAQQWQEAQRVRQEAERVIGLIPYERDQAEALGQLAAALAQQNEYSRLIQLVQRQWLRATHREEALQLLPVAFGLFPRAPELGRALSDAFNWVDRFLQG